MDTDSKPTIVRMYLKKTASDTSESLRTLDAVMTKLRGKIPDNVEHKLTISKEPGTLTGDMINAARTIKDDPKGDKKRLLAGGAGTFASIAANLTALYGTRAAEHTENMSKAEILRGSVAPLPYMAGIAGGGMYAGNHRNSAPKAIAGVGASALSAYLLNNKLKERNFFKTPKERGIAMAGFVGASALIPALNYTAGKAQDVSDDGEINTIICDGALTPEEKLKAIALIKNKVGIQRQYPITRYIKPLQGFDNAVIRRQVDQMGPNIYKMSPTDHAETLERMKAEHISHLVKDFTAKNGKEPTTEEFNEIERAVDRHLMPFVHE